MSEAPEPVFDVPESEVNIQCLKSSEFVVGKQSNYNGPVTIINCIKAKDLRNSTEEKPKEKEEKVIVRNEVKAEREEDKKRATDKQGKLSRVIKKLTSQLTVRLLALVCVLAASVVVLALCLTLIPEIKEGEIQENKTFFYSKADWGGKAAKSSVEMKLPVPYVVVSHTVTPRCEDLRTCASLLRNMQSYHFSLDLADLQYNFLVDSKGHLYEARGWQRRNSKQGFVNGRNLNVALIGDYSVDILPTSEMLAALERLLSFGLKNGKISPSYSLLADNSTYATLSPGKNVYEVIRNWPHFDPAPKTHVKGYDQP